MVPINIDNVTCSSSVELEEELLVYLDELLSSLIVFVFRFKNYHLWTTLKFSIFNNFLEFCMIYGIDILFDLG